MVCPIRTVLIIGALHPVGQEHQFYIFLIYSSSIILHSFVAFPSKKISLFIKECNTMEYNGLMEIANELDLLTAIIVYIITVIMRIIPNKVMPRQLKRTKGLVRKVRWVLHVVLFRNRDY
jgi:hypothetical protein